MLANPNSDWTQRWRQEGRLEGRLEGEGAILLRQLKRRFGPELPSWVETKVQTASAEQLEAWSEAILDATSLEDVVGDDARKTD